MLYNVVHHLMERKHYCMKFCALCCYWPLVSALHNTQLIHLCFLFWTASKQRQTDFDEAVDDLIPIALAQKLRQRLAEDKPETSTAREEGQKKKPMGKKVDHLYCRQTPTEFITCIQTLTTVEGSRECTWVRPCPWFQHQGDPRIPIVLGPKVV